MGPKIRLWDIELGPIIVNTYSLKTNYIRPENIIRDKWIVCAAWKDLGKSKITSTCVLSDRERFNKCYHDDEKVVKDLYDMVSNTDILIAHNGDKFDWKIFMGRCAYHGLKPPRKPKTIDTLKVARKEFGFTSNSLRYLAKHLGLEEKDESPDWNQISAGSASEIRKCVQYNRKDVTTLEAVYERLKPYISNHPNLGLYQNLEHKTCRACGNWDIIRNGYKILASGKYQEYQCKSCGHWMRGSKNLRTTEMR